MYSSLETDIPGALDPLLCSAVLALQRAAVRCRPAPPQESVAAAATEEGHPDNISFPAETPPSRRWDSVPRRVPSDGERHPAVSHAWALLEVQPT